MKLVDEKGKLFGKINVIDLLALLLILAVAAFLGWKFVGGAIFSNIAEKEAEEKQLAQEEWEEEYLASREKITYTVRCSTLREVFYDQLLSFGFPQQLAINDGVVDGAYIVDAHAEQTVSIAATDEGDFVMSDYADRVEVIVTIEALVAPTEFVKVGSQEIRVGKNHIVKTQFWEITGIIETLDCDVDAFAERGQEEPVLPEIPPKPSPDVEADGE